MGRSYPGKDSGPRHEDSASRRRPPRAFGRRVGMMSSKLVATTTILATALLSALVGCTTEAETGACVRSDGADSYCLEDKTESYCSGTGYTLSPGSSCSAVGYAYYCTPSQMRASGGSIYGSDRYLNNSACNPAGGASSSSTSSSSSSRAPVAPAADAASIARSAVAPAALLRAPVAPARAAEPSSAPRSSRATAAR